jgi:cytochrome c nitrite reductase small subunit
VTFALSKRAFLFAAIAAGVLLGLGIFTFIYAEGLSYFGTEPKSCANCHIMNQQYDSWIKSSHHIVAKCVDCHLPQDTLSKFIAKGVNGYHHSKGFTFQDFHEPVMIKPHNSQILQDACLHCHEGMVHQIVAGSTTDKNAIRCVHCHASVGHGSVR